jgi:subtilisin family serine protease
MYLNEYTGRGVRIAVIDSGVHAAHPHVGGVSGGFGIREDGTIVDDFLDRLGHGTAVAAAIREKSPDAEILAIKVFWRTLATDITTLVRAIEEATARGASVINLSLGTAEMQHRERLQSVVWAASRRRSIVVAANDEGGTRWLPGGLDGVVAVRADWTCDRHAYQVGSVDDRLVLATSPYPRDIPGVSRERNVNGISFAVANAAGFVARALESAPIADIPAIFAKLKAAGPMRYSPVLP